MLSTPRAGAAGTVTDDDTGSVDGDGAGDRSPPGGGSLTDDPDLYDDLFDDGTRADDLADERA